MAKDKTDKKPTEKKRGRWRFTDLFAFCTLALAAFLYALGPILQKIFEAAGGEQILSTLNTIARYLLLAAIALPAWYFVRNKKSGWIVLYFIIIIIFILGSVLYLV